ncbi:hypothetical protein RhiirA5_396313 [Rhizophagus irregularis]|uniref:Uncharacterized protein n=3 Tax=Rhizophagus irregularis TaxID=588596 RepID=A0A2I1E0J5_9GLOM|nr:hypothetical protein GLOIN_2v1845079 [Rhizophagus irregularis DAOM 181602=DAOM 197198]PKC13335.1 hypothetical protein RhiirA5_396313 [Rhizophagus irregularis]PKC61651.1 hypothetical protein RhiirA1_539025 [Rhizophagus irregularis]PKY15648.1 hypothetical protein RhiirB3_520579 [Rhizophagus irregularis]POG64878.1 hypothetical protein GLOIN_2v1845079 [Rhizophagus irregularis DAOM 181602=DAOM 197198]UZO12658.1 hypothetical protein OCT59_004182 [Rhizophagus irregularis]|eukprot:XP_025171744.1 hypothetical protein GLOIN_2v1845079 [Rhizophagus irregularis DAOM 181602=DAOM 197198]
MTSSSDIRESQSTTIPESEDGETTLVSPTPDSSTDSLHSQGISPYPASQPPSPSPYDDDDSSKNNGFPTICVIICISLIILLIIIIIVINNIGVIHDKDISRIPLNYELSLKRLIPFNSRFDYVIKGKIFNSNEISKRDNVNNNSSSTNVTSTSNTTNTNNFVLAELISRSLIVIPAGWYEVQEFRYDKDGKFTHKVLTTLCHIEFGLSSLWSAPDVDIQFTTYPPLNLTKKLTLQESMKYCKWKISWTIIMNGYIHKLCPKNLNITENNNTGSFDSQDYEKVAYFKGFEFFGFTFLSLDSKINYGYTTIPNILNMMSRSVYITKDAPFPPIIPAIYTAYYNFITNSRSSISYKHKNS